MYVLDRGRAIVDKRRVLALLIVRDLKVRYAGSALGYVWTVLDPLLMTGVYWFVFTVVIKARTIGHDPYIVFLVIGLLSWQWFSASLTETSRALQAESKLVRSTNLPREIWVLRVVGAKGAEFLFSIPVAVMFAVIYQKGPSWYVLLLPVAVLLQAALLTGIGLALAAATVLVNDLARLVRIALRMLFYMSPVLYAVQRVPEHHHLRDLFALNPMTGIIELYRASLFGEHFAGWTYVGAAAVISFGTLWFGSWVFRRLERAVLKEI